MIVNDPKIVNLAVLLRDNDAISYLSILLIVVFAALSIYLNNLFPYFVKLIVITRNVDQMLFRAVILNNENKLVLIKQPLRKEKTLSVLMMFYFDFSFSNFVLFVIDHFFRYLILLIVVEVSDLFFHQGMDNDYRNKSVIKIMLSVLKENLFLVRTKKPIEKQDQLIFNLIKV